MTSTRGSTRTYLRRGVRTPMDVLLQPPSMCLMSGRTTVRHRTSMLTGTRWHHIPSRKSASPSNAFIVCLCVHQQQTQLCLTSSCITKTDQNSISDTFRHTQRSFSIRRDNVCDNTKLWRIFGPKRDANGEWWRFFNEELHSLYRSSNIVRVIKSRRLRWAGHVARMRKVGVFAKLKQQTYWKETFREA